jgi:beta-lactamase regulating signal transducer with metallopeptidase domain
MSDFDVMRALLFAAELFAGSAVIVTLAWLTSYRQTASARHLVWTAAFAALLALPLLVAVMPSAVLFTLPSAPVAEAMPLETGSIAVTPASAPAAVQDGFQFDLDDAVQTLFAIWAIGFGALALRGLVARVFLYRLRRDSTAHPFDDSELPELASGRRYDLRISNTEIGPVTWGVVRPVVLLPQKSLTWPYERLQAVLRHELAHVARRDSLSQMLARVASALYWPNPLVWLAARRLTSEAEMAADDAVLVSGMMASDYASELLHIAGEFRARDLALAMPLSMAAPSALEARLKSVLAPTLKRSGVTSMDILKTAGIALLATTALVLARPSFAQDAPPVPPAPAAATADVATPPAPPVAPTAMDAPVPPMPPGAIVLQDAPGHHYHIHAVRRFKDRDGHSHVETIDRDGDKTIVDIDPEIARDMARARTDIEAHDAEIRAIEAERPRIEAQVHAALAQARAELAKIDDEKIRAKVDAALARAEQQLDRAHVQMHEDRKVRIQMDDHDTDSDDDEAK